MEAKVKEHGKEFQKYREKQETENLKTDIRYEKNLEVLVEIKERLGKVENDLVWLKRNWSKRA